MATSKATTWIAGTVILCLAILGLGWMFGVSPELESAAAARADADAARAQNVIHQQRLDLLKEQDADRATYEAELADIRTGVPGEDGMPNLLREINDAATLSGVFIVSINVADALAFTAPVVAAAPVVEAPAPEAGAEAEEPADDGAAPVPTEPVAPPVPAGMVVVPVEITVLAPYDSTVTFMGLLQSSLHRLYLVTEFGVVGQKATPASGGRPETVDGDAELRIKGFVYVQQSTAAATAESEAAVGID